MFMNILVGVDGRQGGRDAIALAKTLASPNAEITLAHVYGGHTAGGRAAALAMPLDLEASEQLLAHAVTEAGTAAGTVVVCESSVGRGLHELAERRAVDLLVVGSCRRGLLGRVFLGDDTISALNGAPCAVAIAPAGYADHPGLMREIGIGYDGSPESEHAVKAARALATEHGAKLSAFEAVSIPAYALTAGPVPVGDWFESLVDDARTRIATLGDVEPHAAYGQTAEELALYSASLDLLVVGSRGYGPIGRLVHGSTTQQLARVARCPLLVLTRAARDAEAAETTDDRDAAVAARA